jgi:hypothetical protein
VLGPEHPGTATCLNNLAGLLLTQGDLAGARPLFERALAIYEKVFGPEHPDTRRPRSGCGPSAGPVSAAASYLNRNPAAAV